MSHVRASIFSAVTLCLSVASTALTGCSEKPADGPIRVSVIGEPVTPAPLKQDALSPVDEVVRLATAQGLVTRDATGQIEPGLAERWIVSNDGLSYIFRLRRTQWADQRPVTADDLVRALRDILRSRHWFTQQLSAIEQIVAVTPEILEIRLRSPRPHFLPLLAQPEMALFSRRTGAGPFRIDSNAPRGAMLLTPVINPDFPEQSQAQHSIRLIAERAAAAVARYDAGYTDLVLGGTFATLPYARQISPPAAQLRFDPAQGLFGFAIPKTTGFLATAANRNAIAMAIDRATIVQTFDVPGWQPVETIVASRLDLLTEPARPDWSALTRAQRVELARARVAAWSANYGVVSLNFGVPNGPGSRMLFARIAADLAAIGVIAKRVDLEENADLVLIDMVAPNDSATWYLTRLSCTNGLVCDTAADAALSASRTAPTLAERSARLTDADVAYARHMPFIPIATPLRWSLVRPTLNGYRPNNRAVHPLKRLLSD